MSRSSMKSIGLALFLLLSWGSAQAFVIDVDISSLLNRDTIINNGGPGGLDTVQDGLDAYSFLTQSAATALFPSGPNGLPDNALFPANAQHPDVHLNYSNADNGNNSYWRNATGTFSLNVPDLTYQRLDLFVTSAAAATTISVTLHYADGSQETFAGLAVPDWFNNISQPYQYYLIDGLDRANNNGTGYADANNPAIFGIMLYPADSKLLTSVDINKTASGGNLVLYGATGQGVPEPATLGLLALGGLALLRRRRRT